MFKKLLTLSAVAALCFTSNAKTVVDVNVDFSTWSSVNLAWAPEGVAERMSIEDGALKVVNAEATENFWDLQYNVVNVEELDPDATYNVEITIKGDPAGALHTFKLGNWSEGPAVDVPFTENYETVEFELSGCPSGAGFIMLQSGDYVGTYWIKSIKVSHDEKEQAPVQWEDHLINGDAEGEYGDIPCAYSKEYGTNDNNPYPSPIEFVDGSHVFVVHAKGLNPDDWKNDEGEIMADVAWQNQFWIQSPQSWNTGDLIKISFRYKASKACNTNTQCHKQEPGNYLIWHAIGDVAFTTDWQYFEKQVEVQSDMDGFWSVAFNLGADIWQQDVDFYFDDLKWETMVLDEGWFVAVTPPDDPKVWGYATAKEMKWNEDEERFEVVVGSEENPVDKVKISTKRGNDKAFNSNCIKIKGDDAIMEPDDPAYDPESPWWIEYETKSGASVNLPQAGQWTIILDPEYTQFAFLVGDPYEIEASIKSVTVDNDATVVYYNLQGMRVDNPTYGIYIVKQGNKVSKQVIR